MKKHLNFEDWTKYVYIHTAKLYLGFWLWGGVNISDKGDSVYWRGDIQSHLEDPINISDKGVSVYWRGDIQSYFEGGGGGDQYLRKRGFCLLKRGHYIQMLKAVYNSAKQGGEGGFCPHSFQKFGASC